MKCQSLFSVKNNETICMKSQSLFSVKNKKNIISLLPPEFANSGKGKTEWQVL